MSPKKFTKPRDAAAALTAAGLAKGPKKPRAPARRPEGMSHADWVADVARRKAENERRRARERAQCAREVAEAGGGQEELGMAMGTLYPRTPAVKTLLG